MRNLEHRIWKYLLIFLHFCVYHQESVAELPVRNAADVSGSFELIEASSKHTNVICCYLVGECQEFWLMNEFLDTVLLSSCRQ